MIQIIGLLFWLVIIPFCIGLVPANFIRADKRNPGFVLLAGYFVMWAVFEVAAIPAVLFVKYDNFKTASICFTVLGILCAMAGLGLWYRNCKAHKPSLITGKEMRGRAAGARHREDDTHVSYSKRVVESIQRLSWAERAEWLIFIVLLGFQLYMAAAYASFDGDDAYYVVESLLAQQADVMYRILPYTGRPTDLDIRHALAVFPMWIGFVASKSRIHATIVSHTIMPMVLIPLSYLVYYEIGRCLFSRNVSESDGGDKAFGTVRKNKESGTAAKNKAFGTVRETDAGKSIEKKDAENIFHRENLPIFMILMAMFQIYGNVSIYTNETFFLTRTWQGKAVAGSLVIPALIWMFLRIYDGADGKRRREAGLWIVLVCINMTAGVCSSIVVFLICILMAVTAVSLAVTRRDYRVILKMGAVCIPNVIYMAIYVIVGAGYLL